eukprot:6062779-Pleurochrysis_carterae.AAC.1
MTADTCHLLISAHACPCSLKSGVRGRDQFSRAMSGLYSCPAAQQRVRAHVERVHARVAHANLSRVRARARAQTSHWRQYPPNTTEVYSYFESRGG